MQEYIIEYLHGASLVHITCELNTNMVILSIPGEEAICVTSTLGSSKVRTHGR
jgi:hypothetical protein